jgi:microcystin degradation protein MlrC
MRIFSGSLATETNTFAPFPTGLKAFEEYGLAIDGSLAGPRTHVGGIDNPNSGPQATLRLLAQADGDELIESISAFAQPGGKTLRAVYESLRDRILLDLRAAQADGPVDMVLLLLHGAMVAEGYDDCEGDLLTRVRALVPQSVVGVLLDLHCHLTATMLRAADLVIAVKEYPHVDARERTAELFRLCRRTAQGEIRPVAALVDTRMIGTYPTFGEPMKGIVGELRALETQPGLLSATIAHGFPFADVADVGTRVLVYADAQPDEAVFAAKAMARRLYGARHALRPQFLDIETSLARAAALPGCTVLGDYADNPGGGAAGDSTYFLRALFAHEARHSAIGCFWDPMVASLCEQAGVGARLPVRLGGKSGPTSGDPVDLTVEVMGIQPQHSQASFGARRPLGLSVWLRSGGGRGCIDIAVISIRAQTFDPDAFTGLGMDLSAMRLIVVKSSSHYQAGFAAVARQMWSVRTPGALQLDIEHLPYTQRDGDYFPRVDDPWARLGEPTAQVFDRPLGRRTPQP